MRKQISEELQTLEEHLQTMKKERDSIKIERERLENLKENNNNKGLDKDLANDLHVLKQFVESNVKGLAEKGTVTDNSLMNNERKLIVNNLKQKNVNFMVILLFLDWGIYSFSSEVICSITENWRLLKKSIVLEKIINGHKNKRQRTLVYTLPSTKLNNN